MQGIIVFVIFVFVSFKALCLNNPQQNKVINEQEAAIVNASFGSALGSELLIQIDMSLENLERCLNESDEDQIIRINRQFNIDNGRTIVHDCECKNSTTEKRKKKKKSRKQKQAESINIKENFCPAYHDFQNFLYYQYLIPQFIAPFTPSENYILTMDWVAEIVPNGIVYYYSPVYYYLPGY